MNCVTYARVSTQEQADRELSLPAQQQAMREYARRHDWAIVQEFVEPGVSGRTTERPALRELLARCKHPPAIDVVLVHKIDRLARNVFDHATIRSIFKQHHIKLASVVENVDDTVSGQLVENIMASIAEFYSANLGEEVKKGMRAKVERGGWPHKPPRGYRVVKHENGGRDIELDPLDAPVIKDIFEKYATGNYSVSDLQRDLTERGFMGRTGTEVTVHYLLNILKNQFYAGFVHWHGARRKGFHSALISEALYAKVQDTLRWRQRGYFERGKLHFMLRGVAHCSECGARMTAERHGRWGYYRCVRNTASRGACPGPFSNVADSHTAVVALYRRLHVDRELKLALREQARILVADQQKTHRYQLAGLKQRVSTLDAKELRLAEALAEGTMSKETYRKLTDRIRAERIEATKAMSRATNDPNLALGRMESMLGVAESLYDLHVKLAETERANLLRLVFRQIVLDRAKIVSYKLHFPFDHLLVDNDGARGGDTSSRARHLDLPHVNSTIIEMFEVDDAPLNMLINQARGEEKAA